MGELGQLLREARERKGVSLEEVEAATKIRQKYLIALEEGDYEKLPPGVYVRGFLRSLAAYLDLEAQELITLYGREVPREAIPSPTTFLSQPLTRSPLVTPDLLVGIVLFLAIGVLGAWVFRQYILPLAQVTPTPTPTPAAEIPTSSPAELTVEVRTVEATVESPTPQPTAEATVTSPPPTSTATPIPSPTDTLRPTATSPPTRTPGPEVTPSPQGITLQVAITQRSWLRIVADGQTAFEGVLERDENRTWRGQEEIVIRCGNAGGVLVTVNGESQGVLGGPGEVVVRGWRLVGDRVVVTTPELPTPTTSP
jgi:cytoskeleton protein RodZ